MIVVKSDLFAIGDVRPSGAVTNRNVRHLHFHAPAFSIKISDIACAFIDAIRFC